MLNDNNLLITEFFSLVIILSNSSITSSQSVKEEEILSLFYINISVGVLLSSTILPASKSLEVLIPIPSLVFAHERGYKHHDIIV